jgi:ketosteroid isomerase-like protein
MPVNFVFLRDDPLEDITALRSVRSVWKNAVRYDRDGYRPRFRSDGAMVRTPAAGADSPTDLVEAWLSMWRRYDLDRVAALFLEDDALTYFPSDEEGLIKGFAAVRDYHEELGFASGGYQPDNEMWLEDVTVANLEETTVVGAVWYFGSRANRPAAGRGPLTMVLARTPAGLRIAHVHFGNYRPAAP